jgi:SAM-dependent methyltransferase
MIPYFKRTWNKWQARRKAMGDGAVGRRGEDPVQQGARIEEQLRAVLGDRHFEHALDFGCGWGRFSELLVGYAGHLWSLDIFADWVDRATDYPTASGLVIDGPKIPLEDNSIDLVVDIMTFQSLDAVELKMKCANELCRVATPDCVFIGLVKDGDKWVLDRLPVALGVGSWERTKTTDVDEADDTYYFLEGTKPVK